MKRKRHQKPPSIRTRKQRRSSGRIRKAAEYLGVTDEARLAGAPVTWPLVKAKSKREHDTRVEANKKKRP